MVALASSYLDQPVPRALAAIGEVGLTGEIRSVNQLENRISEVARLGFRRCLIPKYRYSELQAPADLTLIPVGNIGDALRGVFHPE